MKKIIYILSIASWLFAAGVDAATNYPNPALEQRPCEQTEQALLYELSNIGQQQTVDDHMKTARIYKQMAWRGCKENQKTYQQHAWGAIESARALVEVNDFSEREKRYYNNVITQTEPKTF